MNPDRAADRPLPKITISRETTYVTGPLRANGYPDYVAAVNQHCSAGVTPENNAAVPFYQAVGPKEIDQKIRKRFFELLGIPALPDDGPYLVALSRLLRQEKGWAEPDGDCAEVKELHESDHAVEYNRASDEFAAAMSRPWSKPEHPLVARLLEKNDGPLRMLVDGLKRPQFYSPIATQDVTGLLQFQMLLMSPGSIRQLAARAMLHIHEGRTADAWQDILTCYRLARRCGQQPLVVDGMAAAAIEGMADSAATTFAQHANPAGAQAAQLLDDLLHLPERRTFRERWDYGERIWNLGYAVMMMSGEYQPPAIQPEEDPRTAEATKEMREAFGSMEKAMQRLGSHPKIDADEALRLCNAWYDRIVAAYDKPTFAERCAAVDAAWKELRPISEQAGRYAARTGIARLFGAAIRKFRSVLKGSIGTPSIAQMFAALMVANNAGAESTTLRIGLKSEARFSLTCLALALVGYRGDHGHFPPTLAGLRPEYIAQIPKDPFTDADLIYKPSADGCLLYSVGPNGKDDGGRNFMRDDEKWYENESATEEERSWDDIAIRMPPKQIAKK